MTNVNKTLKNTFNELEKIGYSTGCDVMYGINQIIKCEEEYAKLINSGLEYVKDETYDFLSLYKINNIVIERGGIYPRIILTGEKWSAHKAADTVMIDHDSDSRVQYDDCRGFIPITQEEYDETTALLKSITDDANSKLSEIKLQK